MGDYRELEIREAGDGVLELAVGRADRLGSMRYRFFFELLDAAVELRDRAPRALVVRGRADGAFSAGFDTAEIGGLAELSTHEFFRFEEVAAGGFAAIRNLPFPTIAAVEGPAAGGGFALALACDLRLAAPSAVFVMAFVKVGLSAGELGSSYELTRIVGPGRAAELAFTARPLPAEEALAWKLVSGIHDDVHSAAIELARTLAADDPTAVHLRKLTLLHDQEIHSYEAALDLDARGRALLLLAADDAASADSPGGIPVGTPSDRAAGA